MADRIWWLWLGICIFLPVRKSCSYRCAMKGVRKRGVKEAGDMEEPSRENEHPPITGSDRQGTRQIGLDQLEVRNYVPTYLYQSLFEKSSASRRPGVVSSHPHHGINLPYQRPSALFKPPLPSHP